MKYKEYRDSKFHYYKRLAKKKGLDFPEHSWEKLDEEIERVYNELYIERAIEEKIIALFTLKKGE
jgi:Fe-S cluster assembly scaffold protein SufB